MVELNVNFLTSGKQFIYDKLIYSNTNIHAIIDSPTKCVWSAKSSKSENFYQLTSQVKKYKNSINK